MRVVVRQGFYCTVMQGFSESECLNQNAKYMIVVIMLRVWWLTAEHDKHPGIPSLHLH